MPHLRSFPERGGGETIGRAAPSKKGPATLHECTSRSTLNFATVINGRYIRRKCKVSHLFSSVRNTKLVRPARCYRQNHLRRHYRTDGKDALCAFDRQDIRLPTSFQLCFMSLSMTLFSYCPRNLCKTYYRFMRPFSGNQTQIRF